MRRIKYSPDADVLFLELSDERIDHGEHAEQFIIHLAEDDTVVGLEILDASDFVRDLLRAMVERAPESSKLEVTGEVHIHDIVTKLMDDIKWRASYAKKRVS
ncbi:MAG: DUF2283 domain-containing protein [Chloroflexi bacterium]|nr:DUF2283 domain-containing protein [Chloroflexota bacterium]